jgi:hypothetical protein
VGHTGHEKPAVHLSRAKLLQTCPVVREPRQQLLVGPRIVHPSNRVRPTHLPPQIHTVHETGDYTFPYVAGWADEVKGQDPAAVVAATGRRVLSTAHSLIEQIDAGNSRTRQIEPAQKVVERPHVTANVAPAQLLAMHETAASWYRSQLLTPLADGPRA